MSNLFYHLTDSQWKKIEFFFPTRKRRGRSPLNPRIAFNAILWLLKSGARWRDLPTCFVEQCLINICSFKLIQRFAKSINMDSELSKEKESKR